MVEILLLLKMEKDTMYQAAKVHNASCGKRIVIKYGEQSEYRYPVTSNSLSNLQDVINTYTFHCLVEVFLKTLKLNGDWFNMAKQQGKDGLKKSLILSLLLDHIKTHFHQVRDRPELKQATSVYRG